MIAKKIPVKVPLGTSNVLCIKPHLNVSVKMPKGLGIPVKKAVARKVMIKTPIAAKSRSSYIYPIFDEAVQLSLSHPSPENSKKAIALIDEVENAHQKKLINGKQLDDVVSSIEIYLKKAEASKR